MTNHSPTPAEQFEQTKQALDWLKSFRIGLTLPTLATETDRASRDAVVHAADIIISVVSGALVALECNAAASSIKVTGVVGHG
jgi:hypothetical protein